MNHYTYIDDTIILSSSNEVSLMMIIWILKEYERQSEQKCNTDKSFYKDKNMVRSTLNMVDQCLGMNRGSFLMNYLGCPITHTRKIKEHYAKLIERVESKLQSWKVKYYHMVVRMLSFLVYCKVLLSLYYQLLFPLFVSLKIFTEFFISFLK